MKDFVREKYGDVFSYLKIGTVRWTYFLDMESEKMSIKE